MKVRTAFVTLVLAVVPATVFAQDGKALDARTQRVRLQDVQTRTDEVKAQLRRIHGQLTAVSDQVFRTESASKTEIRFKNEMSDAYRLVHVTALLDGKPLMDKEGESLSDTKEELPVFTGALVAGDHTLTLNLTFKGAGYGVFKYLEGYTFNVKSTHAFTVGSGPVSMGMIAYEKGDKTTPLDLRPAVEWREGLARK